MPTPRPPRDASAPILVTGATGNVGVEVVRALRAAGHPVRAAARDPGRARAALLRALALPPDRPAGTPARGDDPAPLADDPGLATVRHDLGDRATWAPAVGDATAMFLVRPPQVADARDVVNPFVDAALAAGVRHVVFLSIQGGATNRAVPHHAIERHLEARARDGATTYTFLRAAFFFQNLTTTHRDEIRDRGELFVPAGDGRTAFVDVRDVAAAAALALVDPATHAGRAYELTARDALTYDEVAAALSAATGRPIRYARPGPLAFWRARRALGEPRGFVLVMEALYATARLGLAAHVSPDLEALLGRPPIDVHRFSRDHADVWRGPPSA